MQRNITSLLHHNLYRCILSHEPSHTVIIHLHADIIQLLCPCVHLCVQVYFHILGVQQLNYLLQFNTLHWAIHASQSFQLALFNSSNEKVSMISFWVIKVFFHLRLLYCYDNGVWKYRTLQRGWRPPGKKTFFIFFLTFECHFGPRFSQNDT